MLDIQYNSKLYEVYDKEVIALVQPVVNDCNKINKRLDSAADVELNRFENIDLLTTLFALYLLLNQFVVLGKVLHSEDFHQWFQKGITNWLNILLIKAKDRIQNSINSDTFQPLLDSSTKHSTSAKDTVEIFDQID